MVSMPAAAYWWVCGAASAGIVPRSAAAKIAQPLLPSVSWSAVTLLAHPNSSPAIG